MEKEKQLEQLQKEQMKQMTALERQFEEEKKKIEELTDEQDVEQEEWEYEPDEEEYDEDAWTKWHQEEEYTEPAQDNSSKESSFVVVSAGKESPSKEEKEAGHQKNRRTVFSVLRKDYVNPNAPKEVPKTQQKTTKSVEDEEAEEE
jgi:hypothetical protein